MGGHAPPLSTRESARLTAPRRSPNLTIVPASLPDTDATLRIKARSAAMLTARIVPPHFYDPENKRQEI